MKYDYIIRNAKLVDFDKLTTHYGTVYVKNGLFAEEPADGIAEAQFTVDAKNNYVVPGLVDEHVHLNYMNSNIGANADLLCIPMGVTTAVDGGTSGWTNVEGFYNTNIVRYVPNVKVYLHVSPYGVHSGVIHEENHDPADFNVEQIINKSVKYKGTIVGLKVRECTKTLGEYGIDPLKKTVEIAGLVEKATGRKCTIDVHYDDLPDNVSCADILDTLRPGDVISHIMQVHKETMFNPDGTVRDILKEAQRRGIVIDDCHGRVHWSFEHLKAAFAEGFYPDIISSDVVRISMFVRPGFSLVHAMNTNLAAGMDELRILKAVTKTPAEVLKITDEAGTMDIGKPADICIMGVQDTDETLNDFWGGSCHADRLFVPLMTFKDGVPVFRQTFF